MTHRDTRRGPAWAAVVSVLVAGVLCVPALPAQETPAKTGQAAVPTPLAKGKKLILKEGGFLLVREYEIHGDRLRYYSVERSAWEEIPASFIDWDATKKAEAEDVEQEQVLVEKIHQREIIEKAQPLDIDASIEAAPGVFLPPGEGVYVLDGKALLPLTQVETDMKRSKGRIVEQVLVPIPVVPSRQNVYLKGAHAKFRLTNKQPEFFIRTADGHEPRIDLVRTPIHGNTRLVENLDTYFTQRSEKRNSLSLQTWQLARGVYRFTLGQPLETGEYALAEVFQDEQMNLDVWDFGVDPSPKKPATK